MALTKIIDLGFEVPETGEPRVQILDPSLVKTASTEIQDFWDKIEDDPEHSYLWVIGVSAREFYGCNNNGDAFDEADLKATHQRFVENANVFLQHVNKDPAKGIGKPVFAWYNDAMHRVELVLKIDKSKANAAETVRKIQAGEPLFVSMGCSVAHDICSICGNKAPTRRDYCDHLRYNMKKILPDGRQVYALNPDPKFFDISIVAKPADPTAFTLDKRASDNSSNPDRSNGVVISSARLGELADDASMKVAALQKLSDIIKRVDGHVVDVKDNGVDVTSQVDAARAVAGNFEHFDYPEMPYGELSGIHVSPAGFLGSLFGMGAPVTLGDAAWLAGTHAFGRCPTPHECHHMFHHLPHSTSHLMAHPHLIDHILRSICTTYGGELDDGESHAAIIRIMKPVATMRITIVRGMAPDGAIEKVAESDFGHPLRYDGGDFGVTTGEIVRNSLSTRRAKFSTITLRDKYGREVKTTPHHLRQAYLLSGDPLKSLVPAAAAALGLGAISCAVSQPSLSRKLLGAIALGIPALALAKPSDHKRTGIVTEDGLELTDNMGRSVWKMTSVKTAQLQLPGLGTLAGMSMPAALALDYAWNKWKYSDYGGVNPYMERGSVSDYANRLGGFIADNPMTSIAAGGVAGAAAEQGLKNLITRIATKGRKGYATVKCL